MSDSCTYRRWTYFCICIKSTYYCVIKPFRDSESVDLNALGLSICLSVCLSVWLRSAILDLVANMQKRNFFQK